METQNQEQQCLKQNNFYQIYSSIYEVQSAPMMYTLYNIACLENMDNILEVGAGSGNLFPELILKKKQAANYTAIDISKEFLQCAKQRLEYLETASISDYKKPLQFKIQNADKKETEKFVYSNKKFNINLKEMNIEKLEFEDSTFEGYFEGFVVHHCDWVKSLSEAHRVLKSGGKLCMAEFGGSENANIDHFHQPPKVEELLKKLYGKNYSHILDSHDHHHEHKDGEHSDEHKEHDGSCGEMKENNCWGKLKIKNQLEKLGFKDILIWDTYLPAVLNRNNFLTSHLGCEEPKSELDLQEQEKIKDELFQLIFKPHADNETRKDYPSGHESMFIVATKNMKIMIFI